MDAMRENPSQDTKQQPIIIMKNIVKSFSGVRALNGITFDLNKGEIHCLVGENGAGKSTLMKVLSGAYTPDSGEITVDGTAYRTLNPHLSQSLGIDIIYQENLLVPTMNVVENIYVGKEISRAGFTQFKAMLKATRQQMAEFGIDVDPLRTIETLSVAEQQYVKILKSLVKAPKILIMDEPTSMFNVEDAGKVLKLVERIASTGISIIYISHFLKEVVQIADRITVIRDGATVNSYDNKAKNTDLGKITQDMVGRPVDLFYKKEFNEIGNVVLKVENLRLQKNSPEVSFELRKGEILGIAGMVGSGRTEIMRAIAGAGRRSSGTITYEGKPLNIRKPRDSIRNGIAFITEDRQKLGLMLGQSILENLTIVGMKQKIKGFFIYVRSHFKLVKPIYEGVNLKASSPFQEVRYLSGGNQQKVVLGKWLFSDCNVFIFDEPTRGIDVNSKTEFYKIMSSLTKEGKSIIMVSSDMPELISMSDRVLVMRKGAIKKVLEKDEITERNIITNALEVRNDE